MASQPGQDAIGQAFDQFNKDLKTAGKAGTWAVLRGPKALGDIIFFVACLLSMPSSLLLRRGIGGGTLVFYGFTAVGLFGGVSALWLKGPAGPILFAWNFALTIALLGHAIAWVLRQFRSTRHPVPPFHIGIPNRMMQALWWRVLGSWAVYPPRAAMIGETSLLLLVAGVMWLLELIVGLPDSGAMPGSYFLVIAVALGVFMQTGMIMLRDRDAVLELVHREQEQTGLAEALDRHPASSDEREVEGIASID